MTVGIQGMMSWFRGQSWLLPAFFIISATYIGARTVNAFVENSLFSLPQASGNGAGSSSFKRSKKVKLIGIAARNLLGAKRENLKPEDLEKNFEPGVANKDDIRKCTLSWQLKGTLVADDPSWSLAVLHSSSDKESATFSINEENDANVIDDDATLIEIGEGEILVMRGDHYERCYADEEPKNISTASKTPSSAPSGGSDDGSVVDKGNGEWEIDRAYLDDQLANLSKVATQARIVPSFKNGKPNGFKLFSIKSGSIFQKIGLQNGDVIQKINGYEMDDPAKGLELYSKLKSESSISVDVKRRGKSINRTYNID